MNKFSIRGLPTGRGAGQISDLRATNALIVVDAAPYEKNLVGFFDLVIACDPSALPLIETPDIYIHSVQTIEKNGVLWLPDQLEKLERSLVVVHKVASKLLAARNVRPKNYMIETSAAGHLEACQEILSQTHTEPGQTWLVSDDWLVSIDQTAKISQREFFEEKTKYGAPKNLKNSARKLIMEK